MMKFFQRNFYFDNWPVVAFQRLFLRQARLLTFRRGQIEFVVDYSGGDQCGILPCLASDMYSRYFGLLERNRPLRILDLGANAGGFCLALLAGGFQFEKLVCVEMNRRTHSRLQFNLVQNLACETVILHAAAGGQEGVVRVSDSPGGVSESIYGHEADREKTLEVPLVTFDGLVQSHFNHGPNPVIDICKMDIEGAEYEVFHSPNCTTFPRVKFLIIDIHPHPTATEADLVAKIQALGFAKLSQSAPGEENVYLFRNTRL